MLFLVRVVLPLVIALAGVALVATGGEASDGAGVLLLGVALLVVLANAFIRLTLDSERDREEEERNRARGVWPDEP
jgi:drug/metabolite transporter (DMT)-like permease